MNRIVHPSIVVLAAAIALSACAASSQAPPATGASAPRTPAEQAAADGGIPAYTQADVAFMQGMIAHHAQALAMTRLAPDRAQAGSVRTLAERIDVSQRDEIAFMRTWLEERKQAVPDTMPASHAAADHSAHAAHGAAGAAGAGLMPGMLTPEQLAQLARARGAEFDRLFLTFMIQHHEGALTMVERLFATPGAGQDVNVFRFASDVTADQETEIARMRAMLASHTAPPSRGDTP